MKQIRYKTVGYKDVYNHETGEMERKEVLVAVRKAYSEETLAFAKANAHNGEYAIEDDGEAEAAPSMEDRLAAVESSMKKILSALSKLGHEEAET